MSKQLTWTLPLMWHLLSDLRRGVEEALQDFPQEVRYAASMVAEELVSNATKHGVSVPGSPSAQLTLAVTENQIQLAVSNGVASESAVEELKKRLAQIADTESKEQLYMNRLQQMLDDPMQTGQLGLYRIGFEGRFRLTCQYCDHVLTVRASREIP
jgi:hypothetical protein